MIIIMNYYNYYNSINICYRLMFNQCSEIILSFMIIILLITIIITILILLLYKYYYYYNDISILSLSLNTLFAIRLNFKHFFL